MISKSFFFAVSACAGCVFAGSPAIGIVTASGHVVVEHSEVWGNSTLFDGGTVESTSASSELALRNGVKLQLGVASRAQIWKNRLALEQGVAQVAGPASYELDAAGLKVRAAGETARIRVSLANDPNDRVEVAALAGIARVTNAAGLFLASIPAGRSMSFSMQAGATGSITRTGCLLYKDGHPIIQDENTQEVVELNGRELAANAGNRVEITGTAVATKPGVTIATSVLNVTRIATKSQGGCLSVAAVLNAQTEAPTGVVNPPSAPKPAVAEKAPPAGAGIAGGGGGGGLSTGAIVGIVAAGGGGAAAAAIVLTKGKSSTSP